MNRTTFIRIIKLKHAALACCIVPLSYLDWYKLIPPRIYWALARPLRKRLHRLWVDAESLGYSDHESGLPEDQSPFPLRYLWGSSLSISWGDGWGKAEFDATPGEAITGNDLRAMLDRLVSDGVADSWRQIT